MLVGVVRILSQAAGFKADLDKLVSAAAKDVEAELEKMAVRRKELSSQNVRAQYLYADCFLLSFYYRKI